MKNFLLTFSIILLIFVSACKKNDPQPTAIDKNQPTSVLTDEQTSAKIKDFLAAVKNPDKSLADMSIENAIWNIEAGLNFSFCQPYLHQSNSMEDSLIFAAQVENGLIKNTEIAQDFQNCVNKMNSSLMQSPYTASHFVVADIALKSNDGNVAIFKLTFTLAETDNGAKTLQPFGSTDYWNWANNYGKCNGYQGTGDAAQQIQQRINANQTFPSGTYFTDIVTVNNVCCLTYEMHYGGANDNIEDYLMFENCYNPGIPPMPNYHTCIPPDEMNFHMNGTNTIFNRFTSQGGPRPTGKTPISIYLYGMAVSNGPVVTNYHIGDFKYGIPHTNSGN